MSPVSNASRMSDKTFRMAVSVEWYIRAVRRLQVAKQTAGAEVAEQLACYQTLEQLRQHRQIRNWSVRLWVGRVKIWLLEQWRYIR